MVGNVEHIPTELQVELLDHVEVARYLPSPNDRLHHPIVRVHKGPALPKRHLPHGGGVDEVPDIKVGAGVVVALADGILDKWSAVVLATIAKVSLQTGRVI